MLKWKIALVLTLLLVCLSLPYAYGNPDTTSIAIAAGGDDGYVEGRHTSYSTSKTYAFSSFDTGTFARIGQRWDGVYYHRYRMFPKFNTTTILEGYTITAAKLRLYGDLDASGVNFYINIRNWTANTPITTADYNSYGTSNFDDENFNTASFTTSGYNNITIADFDIIEKEGYTLLCVMSSRDLGNNQPSGSEYVQVDTYEEGSSKYPLLEITYTEEGETYTVELPLNSPLSWQLSTQTSFTLPMTVSTNPTWNILTHTDYNLASLLETPLTWNIPTQKFYNVLMSFVTQSTWLLHVYITETLGINLLIVGFIIGFLLSFVPLALLTRKRRNIDEL